MAADRASHTLVCRPQPVLPQAGPGGSVHRPAQSHDEILPARSAEHAEPGRPGVICLIPPATTGIAIPDGQLMG